jgi:xylulokinase
MNAMDDRLCIGLDIGTTAIKGICIASDGTVAFNDSIPHDLVTGTPGYAEEDPAVWERHTYELLRRIVSALGPDGLSRIEAIGFTGMVPTLIPLDDRYRPLRNSIQQQDIRAEKEVGEMQSAFSADWFFAQTGNSINQQHIGPKLVWLRRNEPEMFSRMRHIMGSYDYVRFLLCGEPAIERNWALESGLWSLETQNWIGEVLDYCGIRESMLPPVRKPMEIVGTTTEHLRRQTGFPSGVKVVTGSADHVASAFSTGARTHGDLVLKLGGAGDILFAIDSLVTDKRLFIDYQCDGSDHFILNGCTATSGSLLKWFKKEASLPEFETMDDEALAIGPCSGGVTVLPYFMGEKTPLMDMHAKGVIYGLSLAHSRVHVYRAILEAVAYSFRHHIEVFEERGLAVKKVYITNGGSKSTLWRSILADVIGHDVFYIPRHPGSCLGGAVIAGMASGVMDGAVIDTFLEKAILIPYDESNHRQYTQGYGLYRSLYEQLKSTMAKGAS